MITFSFGLSSKLNQFKLKKQKKVIFSITRKNFNRNSIYYKWKRTSIANAIKLKLASSPTATDNKADENASPTTTTPSPATATNPSGGETENDGDEQRMKELPLPPKMQQVVNSSPPSQIAKSASERKLNHMRSMSIKVPRSLSVVRNHLDEGRQRRKEKMKGEESIWTKTIILGEKCKVPDEEDGIIYEGKGKKISAYHPRAHSSMSFSRQGSAIDAEALPNPEAK